MAENKNMDTSANRQEEVSGLLPTVAKTTQPQKTATQQKLEEYGKALSDKIKNAKSAATVAEAKAESCHLSKHYAEASNEFAKSGLKRYAKLKEEPVYPHLQNVTQLSSALETLNKDLKGGIDKQLGVAIGAIKDLNKKIKSVNEAYAGLDAALCDGCNSSQLEILRNKVSGSCSDTALPTDDPKASDFDNWLKGLCADLDQAKNSSATLTTNTIRVASLNAMVNLDNLIQISQDLVTKSKAVADDVDGNLKFMNSEIEANQKTLLAAIDCFSTGAYAENAANLDWQALDRLCVHLTDTLLDGSCTSNWEGIKAKIDELICKTITISNQ